MWQVVESSIQVFNKTRRLNVSFKKTTTSKTTNEQIFVFNHDFNNDKIIDDCHVGFFRKYCSCFTNLTTIVFDHRTGEKNELFERTNSTSVSNIQTSKSSFEEQYQLVFLLPIGQSVWSGQQRTFCVNHLHIISEWWSVYSMFMSGLTAYLSYCLRMLSLFDISLSKYRSIQQRNDSLRRFDHNIRFINTRIDRRACQLDI